MIYFELAMFNERKTLFNIVGRTLPTGAREMNLEFASEVIFCRYMLTPDGWLPHRDQSRKL